MVAKAEPERNPPIRLTDTLVLEPSPDEGADFAIAFTHKVDGRHVVVAVETYQEVATRGEAVESSKGRLCDCWFCYQRTIRRTEAPPTLTLERESVGLVPEARRRVLLPWLLLPRKAPAAAAATPARVVGPLLKAPLVAALAAVVIAAVVIGTGSGDVGGRFEGIMERISTGIEEGVIGGIIDIFSVPVGGEEEGTIALDSVTRLAVDGQDRVVRWVVGGDMLPGDRVSGALTLTADGLGVGTSQFGVEFSATPVGGPVMGKELDELFYVTRLSYGGDDLLSSGDGGLDLLAARDGSAGGGIPDGRLTLRELAGDPVMLPPPGAEGSGGTRFRIEVELDPTLTGTGEEYQGRAVEADFRFRLLTAGG